MAADTSTLQFNEQDADTGDDRLKPDFGLQAQHDENPGTMKHGHSSAFSSQVNRNPTTRQQDGQAVIVRAAALAATVKQCMPTCLYSIILAPL